MSMKLIYKDKLLQSLLRTRDSMYRQYDRLSREVDEVHTNYESKLNELTQISYGIDIVSTIINTIDDYLFDLAEIKNDNIIIFNLCDSEQNIFNSTYEYLCNCGISAIAIFNNDKNMELEEKRIVIDYLARLLGKLKGENAHG